jgi:hypothetical protein
MSVTLAALRRTEPSVHSRPQVQLLVPPPVDEPEEEGADPEDPEEPEPDDPEDGGAPPAPAAAGSLLAEPAGLSPLDDSLAAPARLSVR